MSMYSGKCDIYDVVEMIGCEKAEDLQNYIDNTSFYMMIDGRRHKLDIKNRKDLALYYPYLEVMGLHTSENRIIIVSTDSFIDMEEQYRINACFDFVMKEYMKCKRNKIPFVATEYLTKVYKPSEYEIEIADRIEKDGKHANTDDIHDYMHEYYRKKWFDKLVELGWSESDAYVWVYKSIFYTDEQKEKRWEKYNFDK